MIPYLLAEAAANGGGLNTNTIVVTVASFILLGAIGWVGRKSSDNNDKLNGISASLPYIQSTINDLKGRLDGMVTRPELERDIAQVKVEQAQIKIEQAKIQTDIIRLQQHLPPGHN